MKRTYLFILPILILSFISCDGKDRKTKSNVTILKESKLLDSFSENITYIPAKEVKMITDTILSNGFNLKIKNQTDTLNNISTSYAKDSIKYITHYRQFISDIKIEKDNKSIFSSTINKAFLINKYKSLIIEKLNLDNLRFGGAFVNDNDPTNESVILSLYLDNPIIETLFIYNLSISSNGETDFKYVKKLKYDK